MWCADQPWWHNPQWVSAVITGVIAIITLIYAILAGLQWWAIRHQAEIASKALVLAERPMVIVRNVAIDGIDINQVPSVPAIKTSAVTGQFFLANRGGTVATILEIGCWFYWMYSSDLPMTRLYERHEPENASIVPSADSIRDAKGYYRLRPGESFAIKIFQHGGPLYFPAGGGVGNPSGYVLGWVLYSDDLGIHRRTAFCRHFDSLRKHFLIVANPDYEHAE